MAQLVTGSISSAIGRGGGTYVPEQQVSSLAPSTGRFTGGVRFSDPALQAAFADPLTVEDYAPFQLGVTFSTPDPSYVGSGSETPFREFFPPVDTPPVPASQFSDWGVLTRSSEPAKYYSTEGYQITPPQSSISVYRNGQRLSDLTGLSDRERRAVQALQDPYSAPVFDLMAHPGYSYFRNEWYTSPGAMGQKYGFESKLSRLADIERPFIGSSPGYIPMDFFAHAISSRLRDPSGPGATGYGNIALATDILDAWRQQPALRGQFSSIDDFPSLWWGASSNTEARRRESSYIQNELQEDDGGGLFGGGFFGRLLSFAAPILSFVPGLQPLGWALGAINAIANNNPLGALLSFAGPIMSSISSGSSMFSGVGDLGSGLTVPSSVSFGDSVGGALGGGSLGLQAPANWALSGFSSSALPGISLIGSAAGMPPGFSAGDIGSGITIPESVAASFGTPDWGVSSGSLLGNKLVQQAVKGALQLGARQMMGDEMQSDSQRRLEALRAAQEKQKAEAPMLLRPQAMAAPVAMQASPDIERRWYRLRYGNDPVLEGATL